MALQRLFTDVVDELCQSIVVVMLDVVHHESAFTWCDLERLKQDRLVHDHHLKASSDASSRRLNHGLLGSIGEHGTEASWTHFPTMGAVATCDPPI
jgi:hypothetical protein